MCSIGQKSEKSLPMKSIATGVVMAHDVDGDGLSGLPELPRASVAFATLLAPLCDILRYVHHFALVCKFHAGDPYF